LMHKTGAMERHFARAQTAGGEEAWVNLLQ
jgi:hypothetical protein